MDQYIMEAAIARALHHEMHWGVDDCCLWVAEIVKAHGLPDLAAPFRGYTSRLGAARALRIYGGAGLLEAAQKRACELSLPRARKPYDDGDVAVVTNPAGHLMALFYADRWAARTTHGLAWLAPHHAIVAWRPSCRQP